MPIVEPLPNIPLALDNNILDGWRRQHGVLTAISDYSTSVRERKEE